jgi:hypothetical protein
MSFDIKTASSAALRKYPILIGCSIISIILLIVLFMRSDLIAAQQAELDKYSALAKRYRTNIANASQLQEQLDYLVRANQAVVDRALKADALAQNLQYFYRLESDTGVKYADFRPAGKPVIKGKAVPTYIPMNYTVTVTGAFPNVIRYVRQLERGEYFCRINSVTASGSGAMATLSLNFDVLGVP